MKICCQLPVTMPRDMFGGYYDLLMEDYALHKDPDTEIVITDIQTGVKDPTLLGYYGLREANNLEIVKSMLKAQAAGFDAVAGAAYLGCGAKIASNLMDIPVVDAPGAAMHLARLVGNRFAVVTSEDAFVPAMTAEIDALGFTPHAMSPAPVRTMGMPVNEIFQCLLSGDYDPLVAGFLAAARTCVADGADVIIVGCGLVAPALSTRGHRDVDGAPVIDSMAASLKVAELMVNLSRSGMKIKTNIGLYRRPAADLRQAGTADLNLL